MKSIIKNGLKSALSQRGLSILPTARVLVLEQAEQDLAEIFGKIPQLSDLATQSPSQLGQDIFALLETGFKRNGFFVEFGAASGFELSNTWLLEKEFGWSGIVAEPSPAWHEVLTKNRSCTIDFDCVWSVTGERLPFTVVPKGELSTLSSFKDRDNHSHLRKGGESIMVDTISLGDLLARHNAPKIIDYLSIDTEGSEFEILKNFDFSSYEIRVITVEHNSQPQRELIFDLMNAHGYSRKMETLSKWDDWYTLSR